MYPLYPFFFLLAVTAVCEAAVPDYQGRICPIENGVRLEVTVSPDTTMMIVYPTPPGGGWVMNEDSPGVYSHVISGVVVGEPLTFSLLIQNPTQYVFPEHQLVIEPDCIDFQRDDVTPPPPRGFRQDLSLSENGARIIFESGANGTYLGDTTSVVFNYQIDGDAMASIGMNQFEPGKWDVLLPDAVAGQSLIYWFSQQLSGQPQDTARFNILLGEAVESPDWPIITTRSGRFRHRHPNEWRFDNYVEDYGVGKTFEMIMTDWGNRVDIELAIDEDLSVNRVDFRYFTWNDPFSDLCNRPETLINQIMTGSQNRFTHVVENVTPGTIIDFDLTFIDLPTPGLQYYSEFFYYRVGQGRFGPHESDPRITPVGPATESHVFSPRFGFAQHASTLKLDELKAFMDGKVFFETDFENADLLNLGTHFTCCAGPLGQVILESPVFKPDVIGPRYAAASCIQCHVMDGRGPTPFESQDLFALVAQLSVPGQDSTGAPIPHPFYGSQLDVEAAEGHTPEGRLQVAYEYIEGAFDDGTPYTLRKPTYQFLDLAHGSLGTNIPDQSGTPGHDGPAEFSPRIAPMLAGLGFLEAISDEAILSAEDPMDADGDGISGRANRVWDQHSKTTVIGRFGWKANQPTLKQQASDAFRLDLGITTPLNSEQDCGDMQPDCDPGPGLPELNSEELGLVTAYLRGLTLPPRSNFKNPKAIEGMLLFRQANCHSCHTPVHITGDSHPIEAYRNLRIEPFTDLLLHDMGPELADGRPHFQASGSEWRTPPLWALSYVRHALGLPESCEAPTSGGDTPNFLHDGRARSVMEAILWHGGEAADSREVVLGMTATERESLLAYLEYPFADPIFEVPEDTAGCAADLNGNGVVDVADVLLILDAWGQSGPGDLDQDGLVDSDDILLLLSNYGDC